MPKQQQVVESKIDPKKIDDLFADDVEHQSQGEVEHSADADH